MWTQGARTFRRLRGSAAAYSPFRQLLGYQPTTGLTTDCLHPKSRISGKSEKSDFPDFPDIRKIRISGFSGNPEIRIFRKSGISGFPDFPKTWEIRISGSSRSLSMRRNPTSRGNSSCWPLVFCLPSTMLFY